ncbi:MAG: DUF393 domain-containing protein [Planctomycetales bacterium]|nr:DUF393 domain-containing protein [Planctomycetales bacterium]
MPADSAAVTSWSVEVFYDHECPLCRREIEFLRTRDRWQRIRFTRIATVNPDEVGRSSSELMEEIHGRLPDGQWIRGVEVFRRLYAAIGWTWPVALSRLWGVRDVLDWSYRHFARHRLRLTGRCRTGSCQISHRPPTDG